MKRKSPFFPPKRPLTSIAIAVFLMCALSAANAVVIEDKLTGKSSSYKWVPVNGACLTAGDGSVKSSIPGCVGLPYYTSRNSFLVGGHYGRLGSYSGYEATPDPDGKGALRLTNGDISRDGTNGNNQTGAVVSDFTFPTNEGINVTFTTVTYGGNNYQGKGADGISFMLLDAAKSPSVDASILGAFGGSLAYSCANGKSIANGARGGYLAIGADEFGNFSGGAITPAREAGRYCPDGYWETGMGGSYDCINRNNYYSGKVWSPARKLSFQDNTNTGAGFVANMLVVRGAGETNATELQHKYGGDNFSQDEVRAACKNGEIRGNSDFLNYKFLESASLGTVANQQAVTSPRRAGAVPITYEINLTTGGKLDVRYKYGSGGTVQSLISGKDIQKDYGNPAMPAEFRFAFGAATGGGSNVHEITCFKARPTSGNMASAAANVPGSQPLRSGTSQVYATGSTPSQHWGQLLSSDLLVSYADPSNPVFSIASKANWDANCALTGTPLWAAIGDDKVTKGTCAATGKALEPAPASSARQLITWDGAKGVKLAFADSTKALRDEDRVNFLRGDRSKEDGIKLRKRVGLLGDISNASPLWVSAPDAPYKGEFKDKLYPKKTPAENTKDDEKAPFAYDKFLADNAARGHVVFQGANDGFIHAFRAGKYKANPSNPLKPEFDTEQNDGQELFAYMPSSVLATIAGHADNKQSTQIPFVDFTHPRYGQAYFIDATPTSNDLYYAGKWHTWLAGGLGAGSNYGGAVAGNNDDNGGRADAKGAAGALYVLDVTDPRKFQEAEAESLVIGDWNAKTLPACAGISPGSRRSAAKCAENLGNVHGTPVIRRLHDGNWAVIFGNGLHSESGAAGIFVMTVDNKTGAKSFRFIDTGDGTKEAKSGITHVTSADLDLDYITDYVYAGDINGKVWRFDLSSDDPANWRAKNIFTTTGGAEQPITSGIAVTQVRTAGATRVMYFFGTGQQFPATPTSGVSYKTNAEGAKQAFYGVWDWDIDKDKWKDSGGNKLYASLTSEEFGSGRQLQIQSLKKGAKKVNGAETLSGSQNDVCWIDTKNCSGGANNHYGWKIEFLQKDEQVLAAPSIGPGSAVVFNTFAPGATNDISCEVNPSAGFLIGVTGAEGAAPWRSYWDKDSKRGDSDIVVGMGLNTGGTPKFLSDGKGNHVVINQRTDQAKAEATRFIPLPEDMRGRRKTWKQLR
ncbi:PilC/PilY family type IV pilus protein [Ottowia testudinis]|uniref:Pilus assembly protein PilY n=1 Tax=Ottowia testudinis TaxID=2816950 RepID=A0A975CHG2_9BURK|nr:PilC/PilY family type IV pilus protein [Ottowia testudinis]QTD46270.1 pilus assembly protein PilY [Ottowia testudinis]